ncbi:MAG: ATP-binding protein [candidate division KSB1 bacterium]|nr:ATP-binding protein [candidate division KSB1 bacterium]
MKGYPKILIVEDEPIVAEDLMINLRMMGYDSLQKAATAEEALKIIAVQPPNVVLMDIRLGGELDGIDAAIEIHERWHLPVIFITAYADDHSLERAKASDSFGYILKPFDAMTVKTTIEMALYKHRMAEALRASEKRYRSIFEYSPIGIFQADKKYNIITANPSLVKLFGCKSEEECRSYLKRFEGMWHLDEDREEFLKALAETGSAEGEYRMHTKDGRNIWVLISARYNAEENAVEGFMRDVTKRKEAEEQLQRERQELAKSNAELKQFAYAASHDLQEPLRMVVSYVQMLKHKYYHKLDADADQYIDFAVEGAKRMKQLIADLSAYSHISMSRRPFRSVPAREMVDRAMEALRLRIKEAGAKITCGKLPTVYGDAEQLETLFRHLIDNALKFRRDEPPRIRISAKQSKEGWLFSIHDNGIGIEEQHSDRIFELFQRLNDRNQYSGSGVGLTICKKIVEHHQGRIWFTSEIGKGTTFFFTLPFEKTGVSPKHKMAE